MDRDASGAAVYDRQEVLDARGLASRETVHQRQGGEVVTTVTTSDYGTGSGYALGEVVGSVTTTARGGVSQGSASTTNVHVWGAGAQLASSSVTQANQAPATTDYAYGPGGRLDGVSIRDGRPRTVTILSDLNGQALRRDEADGTAAQGDPHDLWYRFGGREIGHAGVVAGRPGSFAASIAARGAAPATGAFAQAGLRHGAAFVEGVDPITSYEQGADGGRYTVQAGDVATGSAQAALAGIAGRLWGDAGLWYRLAQANGLAGGAALAIGRVLTVPAGVVGSAYHAGLMRGFDPADALGDVSPVTPSPAGKAARRNRCGAFGTVLLVAVAVAVTIATGGAAAAALAPASGAALSAGALAGIGVGAGIAGSVASQGLGLATGLQDGFRWKSVALAGIAGGIGGGLGAASLGRGTLGAVARGALGNALTQGVAVASGLQGRFDWAGVAVGGAVGGVAGAAGQRLARAGAGRFAAGLGAGMAGAVAGGAARSLLTGASFGDTVLATLPDAIGATIGNAVGDRLAYGARPNANPDSRRFAGKSVDEIADLRTQDAARASGNSTTFLVEAKSNADLRSVFVKEARLIAAARNGGYSLDDPKALIGTSLSSGSGGSGISDDSGDITVTGDRTFGDAVANTLVVAQDTLNTYTEGTRDVIGFGLAVLRGGPVGAIGSYALNQAVSEGLSATGLGKQLGQVVTRVGATGFSILSTSSLGEELSAAQIDDGRSTGTLVEAGSSILGLGSLRKLTGGSGLYRVGAYNEIKGTVLGLDAHHVGQKAVMGKLIPGYDPNTAPAILVPQVGHTRRSLTNGIVSRTIEGLSTPRSVVARDIRELRHVYPDIPNAKLQELIRANKNAYPDSFTK